MRFRPAVLSTVVASTAFWNIALAQTVERQPTTAPPTTTEDCHKAGGEVSALIDNRPGSPNLPAARAVFQVGIMECMEGDESAANKHYEQAKQFLAIGPQAAPNSPDKK